MASTFGVKKVVPQEPYQFRPYPKWITCPDGSRMIVNGPEHHTQMIGKPVDENGNLIEEKQDGFPPTLETVIAAGYAPEVAEKMVMEEQYKYDNGYPPYGTNQPPAHSSDAAAHTVVTPMPVDTEIPQASIEKAVSDGGGVTAVPSAEAVAVSDAANAPVSTLDKPEDKPAEKAPAQGGW